jgi:hypothetical protein
MKAMTVSRDGTDNIDPSMDFALAMNAFPYSHGCSEGSAIAGCVENLKSALSRDEYGETDLAAIPAMELSKKLDPVLYLILASKSLLSIQGNWDPK